MGSLAWDLSLGIFRFGSFAWALSLGIFRLGSLAWDLELWIFSLEPLAWGSDDQGIWEIRPGESGWGDAGGIGRGGSHYRCITEAE